MRTVASLTVVFGLAALACAGDEPTGTGTGTGETGATGDGDTSNGDGDGDSGDGDTSTGDGDGDSGDGDGEPLAAEPGAARYVLVGDSFELDGSASTGAVLYHWDFGDGTAQAEPSADPLATHSYAAPGRYYPILTVYDAQGNSLARNVTITATKAAVHFPVASGTVIDLLPTGYPGFAALSPDSDEVVLVRQDGSPDAPEFVIDQRIPVCSRPRSLGLVRDPYFSVTCDDGQILVGTPNGGWAYTFDYGPRSRPFATVATGNTIVTSLAATGELALFDTLTQTGSRIPAIADARGLALWPDGRIAVTRWRSPDDEGQIVLVDVTTGEVDPLPLAYDPTPPSDTEIGGVPSYLDQVLVSPIGDQAAVPSIQANFLHGEFLTGEVLSFETTVRAVVSFVELGEPEGDGHIPGAEVLDRRKQFDNRGFAAAGVFSSRGDYLFVAMRGSRVIERYDVLTGGQAGSILDVGYAPTGLALSHDDRYLVVNASLSRELRVYDVSSFAMLPTPIAVLPLVEDEPLDPEILRGKQLFNDSFDPKLAKHGYIACAHCHLDGEADHRTWDFTDRGEGLRNTISLLGRGGMAHGPVHWSANFDEIQDFEHDLRGPFGGFGLLSDAQWAMGTVSEPLGDAKAGLSPELDALAAYVASLDELPASPWLAADGELTPAAAAGQALFESPALGCVDCHAGASMTDSQWLAPATPLVHDVGTLGPGSGLRLGEPLTGLDTPTLRELWNSAPYLHDGSAASLLEVLTSKNSGDAHGVTSQLTPGELEQLVAYLLSL